ncbi:transposase domain-containing protein [Phaeobacter sp. HF9A]|uniref:transposase domain-containing protein n=1 Tax=Phaeobacter sp. HF9A TaxID=2721561 RepID=UPI0014310EC4|nr:transposase domain-containing protein [Phaeobacter sp. HF9A]NIZ13934.1 transposase [Phaeobacter sp. HF9A]
MDAPTQEWWSAAEIADARLPDLPATKRKINQRAKDEGWDRQPGKVRRRKGKGGGLEYHYSLFPIRARLALIEQPQEPEPKRSREAAWADFDRLNDRARTKADQRLKAVRLVAECEGAGMVRSAAVSTAALRVEVSEKSIWNWLALVEGVAEADWLAYVAPKPTGGTGKAAPLDPEFFALVRSDWLRLEQPSLTSCYDRAKRVAKKEGLPIAPIHQVRRAMKASISKPTEIVLRKGTEALRRYYPHQDRDKSALGALECICGDYHKFDVFVRWPSEPLPVRVQGVFFTDIYSGKILSWRLSLTANSHTVQLAIGDLIERYGIPQAALLDNGREFAAKVITGGAPTRFRFKVLEDDIPGLLPMLGVKVHWATPYSGQSKPIERAFRDLCDRVAKHPAFEGAYTGNKPDAKPENYGNSAVPLDDFIAVLTEEVEDHNAREGRRSEIAYGRSFNQVFEASYKSRPIRKATEEQRRLWLMGAKGLTAAANNGELKLMGSRYWAEWMYRIAGQKVVGRFDPDNIHAGLHVYDLEGQYIGHAACVEKGDFLGVSDAREVARKRSQFQRAAKEEARASRDYSAAEIAARLRAAGEDVTPSDLPQAEVVQLVTPHRNAPKAPRLVENSDQEERLEAQIARLADRRAPTPTEDDPEEMFNRCVELEQLDAEGHPLTEEQRNFMTDYQRSAQYRSFLRMRKALGSEE